MENGRSRVRVRAAEPGMFAFEQIAAMPGNDRNVGCLYNFPLFHIEDVSLLCRLISFAFSFFFATTSFFSETRHPITFIFAANGKRKRERKSNHPPIPKSKCRHTSGAPAYKTRMSEGSFYSMTNRKICSCHTAASTTTNTTSCTQCQRGQ